MQQTYVLKGIKTILFFYIYSLFFSMVKKYNTFVILEGNKLSLDRKHTEKIPLTQPILS